jgi:hypothetical protein
MATQRFNDSENFLVNMIVLDYREGMVNKMYSDEKDLFSIRFQNNTPRIVKIPGNAGIFRNSGSLARVSRACWVVYLPSGFDGVEVVAEGAGDDPACAGHTFRLAFAP